VRLATAWQSNKFLDAVTDGAVLPILHLNGYKISNPTVLARIEHEELEHFFQGCGWTPYFVEGDEPEAMHQLMAEALETAIVDIRRIQTNARATNNAARPRWPMIVLKSPKGWTGPKVVDGLQIEGTFRAHQVPLLVDPEHPDHVALLESWMKSYKAEELFDANGTLVAELAELAPKGDRRMGPIRTPMAAACCVICGCPTSACTRSACRRPVRSLRRIPSCWASSCATWSRSTQRSEISGCSVPMRRCRIFLVPSSK
jgi:xylulose-5-phosphate/fructose-6-phosphate phosphoketolase